MKRTAALFLLVILFASCKKDKCYIISDCMGNDLQAYCGSESEIRDYCNSHQPPGCTWTYREE